jgi:hypothetical protein
VEFRETVAWTGQTDSSHSLDLQAKIAVTKLCTNANVLGIFISKREQLSLKLVTFSKDLLFFSFKLATILVTHATLEFKKAGNLILPMSP